MMTWIMNGGAKYTIVIRSVNMSAPITRIKSFNQVAQFERAITAARESPNVTERLRAELVCGEELIAPLGARIGAALVQPPDI